MRRYLVSSVSEEIAHETTHFIYFSVAAVQTLPMTGLLRPSVSTIIATMAAPERAALLKRAVTSVRHASIGPIAIIVVVNGDRSDPMLCSWLQAQQDIHLEVVAIPSLPNAVLRGRELVKTEFFSTLDDDDEYVTGGIDIRLEAMSSGSRPDVVVTNGHRRVQGLDILSYTRLEQVPTSPLEALFHTTWLQSGNALYRSATVGTELFSDHHAYAEWTWLAFLLALNGKRIAVVDVPTFICHDTPGSLSKSTAYRDASLALYWRMLEASPPPAVVRLIQRRIQAAWHDRSYHALTEGKNWEALRYHLRSLAGAGGFRYLSFSRRLLPGWPKG